jgi:putative transposon-encoded protein
MKKLGSLKLKRHSTRHVSEVTTIASKFGNSAKIIVPRSWLKKRVIYLCEILWPYDVTNKTACEDVYNGRDKRYFRVS